MSFERNEPHGINTCYNDLFFIFLILLFKNISLTLSRSVIKGGRKMESLGKNHLTIRKQNLAWL